MADSSLPQRASPLRADYQAGNFGADLTTGPGLDLGERRDLSMVQVEAAPGEAGEARARLRREFGLDLPQKPNTGIGGENFRMIWTGPERWLLVEPESRDLETHVFGLLAGMDVAVVDLSHARAVFRLAGPAARRVLAKGAGLDFHEQAFGAGCAAQTVLFHVSVLLDCNGEGPSFDIYAARGFSLDLWRSLCRAGAEYGYRISYTKRR